MATLYGDNASKRDNTVPAEKIDVNEDHGRVRVAHDQITLSSNLSSGDTIKMMKLPEGAKLYQAIMEFSGALGTPDLDVGWDGGDNGDETADEDGIFAAVTTDSASVHVMVDADASSAAPAGFLKEFNDEVQIEITADADAGSSSGKTIGLTLYYVLD